MNIDLNTTLLGGQAFNWDYIDHSYYGFTQKGAIKITPGEGDIHVEQKNENVDINKYLGLDIDHESIKREIDRDEYIHKALLNIDTVAILRQDFLQTTLSYILATNKNIPAIRKSIRNLSRKYGKKIWIGNTEIYTFPQLEDIANADIPDLRETKIGYRAEYIKGSSQILLEKRLDERVNTLSKEEIKRELLKLPGIGPKVADCILLYSLGFLDTVPVDIWMYNIAKSIYKVPFKEYTLISNWYTSYFGQYAGIAAQYLFEFYRKNSLA